MHFFSRRNASLALSLAAVGVLAACGDDVTVPVAPPAPVVISITPQAVTLNPGASATLSVQISGGAPTPTLASCASGASGVATATVSGSNCAVTAVGSGSTTITATTSAGQSASAAVTVNQLTPALGQLTVSPATAALTGGQTVQLVPNPNAAAAGVSVAYTYVSSSSAIASVNSTGVVTAGTQGVATITVTATGTGTGFAAATRTFGVTINVVSAPPAINSLTATPSSLSLAQGGTGQVAATVQQPTGAPAATLTFGTTNPAVASVTTGANNTATVTGVSAGTATITVTATAAGATGFAASTLTQLISVTVSQSAQVSIGNITEGQTNNPIDITDVRNQIQVALNITTNGQEVSSAQVWVCEQGEAVAACAARTNGVPAAQQTFGPGGANNGIINTFINTAEFTVASDWSAASVRHTNGQKTLVATLTVAGQAAVASNNLAILNFNNMDGYAARHVAPTRSAISGSSTTMFGGPGAEGRGSVTIAPVLYTAGRSLVSVTAGLTGVCGGTTTFTSATARPWTYTYGYSVQTTGTGAEQTAANTAARNLICGAQSNPSAGVDPDVGPAITASIDNSQNAGPVAASATNFRTTTSTAPAVTTPAVIRVDYVAPTITWVQNPQGAGQQQFWVNASYNFARTALTNTAISFADAGVGLPTTLGTQYGYAGCPLTGSAPFTASARMPMTTNTGADIPECATDFTGGATPGPYVVDATQADLLSNSRTETSARFGVDKTAPNVRFAATTYGGAANADTIVRNLLPAAGDTLFAVQFLDDRSGFVSNTTGAFRHALTRAAQNAMTGACVVPAASTTNVPGSAFITNSACPLSDVLTLAPDLQPTLGDGFRQARAVLGSDVGPAIPAYLSYKAQVTDRAGNSSATLSKRYVINNQNPQLTGLGVPGTLSASNWSFVPNYTDLVEAWFGNLRLVFPQVNTFLENSATSPDTLVFPAQQLATRFDDAILAQGNSTLTGPASWSGLFYTGIETVSLTDLVIGSPAAPLPTLAGVELTGVTGLSTTQLFVPLLPGNVAAGANWATSNPFIQSFKMDSLRAGFNAPVGPKAIVRATTNQINAPFVRVDFWRKATASNGVQESWQLVGSVSGSAAIPSDGGATRTWSYVITTGDRANVPGSLSVLQDLPAAGQRIMACGVKADGRALCSDPFMNSFGGTLQ